MPTPPIDPCKLSAATISGVVGFAVTQQPKRDPETCDYEGSPDGSVNIAARPLTNIVVKADKSGESFSLGGRYITITDETGFPKGGFTAVKNPGDKSPGVIADAVVYVEGGRINLRIYYPSAGRPPGRAHALRLAHLLVG